MKFYALSLKHQNATYAMLGLYYIEVSNKYLLANLKDVNTNNSTDYLKAFVINYIYKKGIPVHEASRIRRVRERAAP